MSLIYGNYFLIIQERIIIKQFSVRNPYPYNNKLFCHNTHTQNVRVPLLKCVNLYVCVPLLALRVVKYERNAGKKVIVSTKTNAAHKCRLGFLCY